MANFVALAVCCAIVGAALFCSAFFASRGILPRNRWIGIRLGFTLSSDVAWRIGHRAALKWGAVAVMDDVCCLTAGLVLLLYDGGPQRAVWGPGAALASNVLIFVPYLVSAYKATRDVSTIDNH
ncbi:SdpI family protein [Propionibacterium acidifaciens]|uniref:SdpI family protein n=1 Tax=Propionibacterium acidifaciens TaxID=556499 RepID=UPI0009DBF50D|nr:SdpI family protein [Propionibacterium acidifaciens]